MNQTIPLTVAARFVMTLEGLYRAVAARSARGVFGWAMATATILMVCRRIRRVEGQIQGLLARFRAGGLAVRPVRAAARRAGTARARVASAGLPRRFGWLLPMVPHEAANFASQLRGVLAEPEMAALLAASAQARRTLAPVCRMLGIEAALLSPPGAADPDGVAERVAPVDEGDDGKPPEVLPEPVYSPWWLGTVARAPSG